MYREIKFAARLIYEKYTSKQSSFRRNIDISKLNTYNVIAIIVGKLTK